MINGRPGTDRTGIVRGLRRDFGGKLRQLREEAGLSLKVVAEEVKLGTSALSELERGRGKRPPDGAKIRQFIETCLASLKADEAIKRERKSHLLIEYMALVRVIEKQDDSSVALAAERGESAVYAATHLAYSPSNSKPHKPKPYEEIRPDGGASTAARRALGAQLGRKLEAWDPFALDIHAAVSATPTGKGADLPPLPKYIYRAHDEELDSILTSVHRSIMLVLIGGSSVGKSRALYEAVKRNLNDWTLVYPRTSAELLALARSEIRPRTVLWINDTQQYLSGIDGDSAAAQLLHQLDGSLPGPTVILGTLWPEHWSAFTSEPHEGELDPHPNAKRLLLHSSRRIWLPEVFTAHELDRLNNDEDLDPRVTLAARTAGRSRKVIQVLAGGPALLSRYDHPCNIIERHAKALITIAMDAARLGHHSPVPREVLVAASASYVADDDRVDRNPTWFDDAIEEATSPVHGIRALTPQRASGVGNAEEYELHDYLDQHARTSRRGELPDRTLWEALAAFTKTDDDRIRISRQAFDRGLIRYANSLAVPCAERGNTTAMMLLSSSLISGSHAEEGLRWLRRAAAAGDSLALNRVVDILQSKGLVEEADVWLIHAALAGDAEAMLRLSGPSWNGKDLDSRRVRRPEEVNWLQLAAASGNLDAICDIGESLAAAGKTGEAEGFFRIAAEADFRALHQLVDLLEATGRHLEARQWLFTSAGGGDQFAMARLIYRDGEDLDQLMEMGFATSDPKVSHRLGSVLEREGRVAKAEQLWRHAAEAGDGYAMWRLADLLDDAGDIESSVLWLHKAIAAGEVEAMQCLADRLRRGHWDDEAEQVWRRPAETGHPQAMYGLGVFLWEEGRLPEAEYWLRRSLEAGVSSAMVSLQVLLNEAGREAEANRLGRLGIEPGGLTAGD